MGRLKSFMRRAVGKFVHPHRLNDTGLYRLYLSLFFPAYYKVKQAERAFYHKLLRQVGTKLVIDVGANDGNKAVIFAEVAEKVVCVEPSAAAVRILTERFAKSAKIVVVAQGVGAQAGTLPFYMFGDTNCFNTFATKLSNPFEKATIPELVRQKNAAVVQMPVTTLDAIIDQFGLPTYIKIDVEGFECEVLRGLSQMVNLISLEANLPTFESETLACLSRLEELCPHAEFNYCTSDPPATFSSSQWLTRDEIAHVVTSQAHPYLEIYARPRSD